MPRFLTVVLCCCCALLFEGQWRVNADGIAVDGNGDLTVTPHVGRAVLVQGVDVAAAVAAAHRRLGALEAALQVQPAPMPAPPSGPAPADRTPRIGQDPLGNLLLSPAPNRTLVMAGVRVLELLTHARQRLSALESLVFGPGAVTLNVTSILPPLPSSLPSSPPGTVGLGADGSIRIEPLAGKAVLAAGRDIVLELHRIAGRLNLTERAMVSCPCLAPPTTCRPCNIGGCNVSLFSSSSSSSISGSFLCDCNSGWQGPDCRENPDECALGLHNCSPNATCTPDSDGTSICCTCNVGYAGNGTVCARSMVQWAQLAGSTGTDMEGRVALDEARQVVYLVGWADGPRDNHTFAGGPYDIFLTAFNSSRGTRLWSRMLGSGGLDYSHGMAVDGAGSVYVTGYTSGASLDGQANAGEDDVLLARYDNSGSKTWTRLLGTASADWGLGVAVDRSSPDAVYVGGFTRNTTGGGLPGSAGGHGGARDAFVARYASNGTRVWVLQFGTSGDDECRNIAVHQSGIYATGYTDGVMAGTANAGSNDMIVVRITALGVVAWTAQLGSASFDYGRGIAADSSGVYVSGWTGGNLSGQPHAGGTDTYVARFTLAGVWLWTRMLGTSAEEFGHALALDRSSTVLVAGRTNGALGGQTNAGGFDAFVASFTSDGVLQWTRLFGTTATDQGQSIAAEGSSGAAYVAGSTQGPMFGQTSLGASDLFVMRLQYTCPAGLTGDGVTCSNINECAAGTHNCSSNATCTDLLGSFFSCACNAGYIGNGTFCARSMVQWARQIGSGNMDDEGRLAMDNAGRVIVAGRVGGSADGLAYGGGGYDVFLTAYNGSTGTKLWSRMLGSGSNEYSNGVAADGAGNVFVAGYITGGGLDEQGNAGGNDAFLVCYNSSSGSKMWARLLGTNASDVAFSVAADRSNPDAVYIGGSTDSTSGAGLPGSAGGLGGSSDAFVARYASNGTRLWVRQFGTGGLDRCFGVAAFGRELYATGDTGGVMAGTANFGNYDIVILKFTELGTTAWTAQLGSPGNDMGLGIAVDSTGVFVTGYAGGRISNQTSLGNSDVLVARYTHAGALVWIRILGTSSFDFGTGLALGRNGNVLITGYTSGALGGQSNAGGYDAFVASFTSDGVLQWTRLFGTADGDFGISIAADSSSGDAFVAGSTQGSMLGQTSLGSSDLFVMRLQYACPAGLTGDGVNCSNINECAAGTHNCSRNATCTDLLGSFFSCACNAGFTGNGTFCSAVNITLQWARLTGSEAMDYEGQVAVDDAGRVFLAGYVSGAPAGLGFAGGTFDVLLIAYNGSNGARLWAQTFGAGGDDFSQGIATDGAGSVYVTGYSAGGVLNGQVNEGANDAFLACFNSSSGAVVWTRLLGTGLNDYAYDVAVDPGNPDAIYMCGFTVSATGSGLPDSAGVFGGPGDAFLARYARNGTRVWVRQFGTGQSDFCYGVAVYQSEVYAVGLTTGDMAASAGGWDVFVTKVTALGVGVWTVQFGSAGDEDGRGIAVDSSGVYVTGYTTGSLGNISNAGSNDAFVARYTHAGAWAWTRMLGTDASDTGFSVALDRNSNVLIAGLTFGALSGQANAGSSDVFVVSFTSTGQLLWTRLFGTPSDDRGLSVAADRSSDAAYVAGLASGSMLGQTSLGGSDLFVLKLQ